MLDRKRIASHPDEIMRAMARRGPNQVKAIEPFLELEGKWKELKSLVDELRHHQKQLGSRMKLGPKDPGFAALKGDMADLSRKIKDMEVEIRAMEGRRHELLMSLPNLPHESVPDGSSEKENLEVKRKGEAPSFSFEPKAHWDLGPSLGIMDFDAAARMSGARFTVLRGTGALMERALIQLMLDLHTQKHGYVEIWPPYLVKRHTMEGTGQLPNLEADCFRTDGEDPYYLIPTAEVPLVNLHREEILDPKVLPMSYVAFTPCFRAEAGSYGQDVRGLIRQHQFSKVELVKITRPEESYEELERLRGHAEAVLELLELPYRTMLLCSGDMGFAAAKTYDLEVWLPGQGRYREISSCSNCEDFQARRAMIRYRHGKGDNRLVHTLNGSGLAVGRTLLAILENNQQKDGSVKVPRALLSYMNGVEVIEPPAP